MSSPSSPTHTDSRFDAAASLNQNATREGRSASVTVKVMFTQFNVSRGESVAATGWVHSIGLSVCSALNRRPRWRGRRHARTNYSMRTETPGRASCPPPRMSPPTVTVVA